MQATLPFAVELIARTWGTVHRFGQKGQSSDAALAGEFLVADHKTERAGAADRDIHSAAFALIESQRARMDAGSDDEREKDDVRLAALEPVDSRDAEIPALRNTQHRLD